MSASGGRLRIHSHRPAGQRYLVRLTLSIFAFMVFLSIMYSTFDTEFLPQITVPEDYWKTVSREEKVLMYFAQANCIGCKKIQPSIERLAKERGDEIAVYEVDLDAIAENAGIDGLLSFVSSLGVRGTPTLIVYVNGREVARHEGTFGLGDQYGPLLSFVEKALANKDSDTVILSGGQVTTGLETLTMTVTPEEVLFVLGASFAFGLLAAVSPCSLPMVLAFASTTDESRRFRSYLANLAMLISVAIAAGSLLALLYLAGSLFPLFNPLVLILYAGSAFMVAWGLLSLIGVEPMINVKGRARLLFPVLGLQCSLPFLIAIIALSIKAPHLVFGSALLFASGYGLPYALSAAVGGGFINRVISMAGSRPLQVVQGLALLGAGIYIYYNTVGQLI